MPLNNAKAIFPATDPEFTQFPSRRSVVHSSKGMVACTQPLAAQAGIRILREGGNAADAAVAVAAALNLTEPSSTGIGGDMFALFYDAKTKKVRALNGSGRSTANISLNGLRKELGIQDGEPGIIPVRSPHTVTVPGAAAGWVDVVEQLGNGKLSMEQILMPAIELAEDGFPVSELSATFWKTGEEELRKCSPNFHELLKADPSAPDGYRAPNPGDIFRSPNLAQTFRRLAREGKKGFYEGPIAEAIVNVVQSLGGHLSLSDLAAYGRSGSDEVTPISMKFNGQNIAQTHTPHLPPHPTSSPIAADHGVELWECPPNGQGIVALMALGILESLEASNKIPLFKSSDHNTAPYLHAVIESLRIAFSDANWFVSDPQHDQPPPIADLLSPTYLSSRASLFSPTAASPPLPHGTPSPAQNNCDTVYLAVTDQDGNGISFINSIYSGFGSSIIPATTGFVLQNRGAGFALHPPTHPNLYAPCKRPYHTIIPALLTNPSDQSLHTIYGVMGGYMQPQGHVQVLLNMLAFRMNPQQALDAPRFCIGAGLPEVGEVMDRTVYLEDGIPNHVLASLRQMGHHVQMLSGWQRGIFGRGQVIRVHEEPVLVHPGRRDNGQGGNDDGEMMVSSTQRVYSAGSDMRGDGAAFPL